MEVQKLSAPIAAGATGISGDLDLNANRLARIAIPAGWVTANITFQTSHDNATWGNLYNPDGTEYTVTVGGASREVLVNLVDFLSIRYLRVRSGTAGTPVNQTGAPTLTLLLVP